VKNRIDPGKKSIRKSTVKEIFIPDVFLPLYCTLWRKNVATRLQTHILHFPKLRAHTP